jgi:hypothetical protein
VPELSIFARNYPFLPETISPETIQKVKKWMNWEVVPAWNKKYWFMITNIYVRNKTDESCLGLLPGLPVLQCALVVLETDGLITLMVSLLLWITVFLWLSLLEPWRWRLWGMRPGHAHASHHIIRSSAHLLIRKWLVMDNGDSITGTSEETYIRWLGEWYCMSSIKMESCTMPKNPLGTKEADVLLLIQLLRFEQ